MTIPTRIGIGFDVHPFAEGRKLILGNIEIPADRGLQGHSDADVLLHAITDAVLGALGWGDIGKWFPDTDEKFRGIDSSKLLLEVWQKASAEGWVLGNCDSVIIAQRPKIAPYVERMQGRIAELFGADQSQINLKATTTERLGAIGREEGIAAQSVVLLSQRL